MATAVICICVNVGMKGYDMYRDAISQISLKDKVEQIRSKENYTEFAELPETYVDAVLSVEDHRFYDHIGIDPIAITRAVINDIRAGAFVEGGSVFMMPAWIKRKRKSSSSLSALGLISLQTTYQA